MTDRELSASDLRSAPGAAGPSVAGSIAGRTEIAELLHVHSTTRDRSTLARVLGVSPLTATGRVAYRLAMGEVDVGDALDALARADSGWQVLHSVAMADGTELDHLLIGPAGVFIVTTVVHSDGVVEAAQRTFTVSDERYPHIREMEHGIGRVEGLLAAAAGTPIAVSGILAVVEPRSLVVHQAHRDVAVISASSIVRWLSRRPTTIAPAEIERIAAVARRGATWGTDIRRADDATELRGLFDALRAEVDRAWSLHRLWTTAITVLAAGALIVVTCSILVSATGS
jgi:Nuclease-related domain